jgi:hypothetical protein
MTIGAGLFLIALGAILRFGVTTAFTHGFSVHTVGDILMIVGALGVVLWLVVWAPWGRSRHSGAPSDEVHEVYTTRRYPGDGPPYGDQYPR